MIKEKVVVERSSEIVAPAAPSSSSSSSDSESDHEQSEVNSTHSAELHIQDINEHRLMEERLTEAEKNVRLQKKLMVSSGWRKKLGGLVLPITHKYCDIFSFSFLCDKFIGKRNSVDPMT